MPQPIPSAQRPLPATAPTTGSARAAGAADPGRQSGDMLRLTRAQPRPAQPAATPASMAGQAGTLALGAAALWAIVALGGPSAYVPFAISAAIVTAMCLGLRQVGPRAQQAATKALAEATGEPMPTPQTMRR
ncbi:MAG: hypothetical protein VKS61_10300 [Candidatus Sericytochromatia bacterium]|nr:hypothetical protein [Candidatus Sericytochromatia bacterium]